ncbi:hypothetical protein [uncultured Roseobacter sp.]|uniref:hypothetical protein n=1 Tax=uncultured Roseobacter sp. TaxID=114847 RepID=UPI00262CCE1B|nr:hypothetical protein [uncultured Roseobacter sp.]
MPKTDTNSDVEDVLSSIRRLVSDKATRGTVRAASDTLVLSPQQRVSEADVLKLRPSDAVHLPEPQAGQQGDQTAGSDLGLDELSATIEALETEIAETADQWEPDGTGSDDYAGTAGADMKWPQAGALDATGAPLDPDEAETPEADDLQSADQILDEAALRDLVAEIVRFELQGPLGERITRNIRKLVRREIHRALAARDLN